MLGSGKGKSGNFDNYWSDFVDRDHTRNPGLTREHVEYTIIYMCQRGLWSRLPFTFPSDEETDQVFNPSKEAQKTSIGDVTESTNVSNDSPHMFTSEIPPTDPTDDDLSDEDMFEDDNTTVGAISIPLAFHSL